VRGGAPITLCVGIDMGLAVGAWLGDDAVVFSAREHPLRRVSADGGEPQSVTTIDEAAHEVDHHSPAPLPGGRAMLFAIHRSEDRFSIAISEFAEQHQRFHIRTKIEKILRRNLAGHDRVMNILGAKKFQKPAELPDTHPFEDIHVSLESWVGFVCEGGSDDFLYAGSTCSVGKQSRVNAVAGNYSQGIWNIHRNSLSF